LFIFSLDLSYQERNFSVRISSATVELERSDFTVLAGFARYIMPLSGSMRLTHTIDDGSILPEVNLEPFDVHYFNGEWQTVSNGACTDFNLMLAHGWDGDMKVLSDNQELVFSKQQLCCLYSLKPLSISFDGKNYDLLPDDTLCVEISEQSEHATLGVRGDGDGLAAIARAWKS